MPYVRCGNCGIRSYTAPPYAFSADCPVCGSELLPAALSGKRERPSLVELQAAARAKLAAGGQRRAGTAP
jgi:hypothetical protein